MNKVTSAINGLNYFACVTLLGLAGKGTADLYDARTARLAVHDLWADDKLTDAQILEAAEVFKS